MNFYIGCAVWAYKGWLGELYPPGTRNADFLNLYSRRFSTVEGNTTFYATPNAETVTRWATETPPGFEFCLKLPQNITHQKLLQPHIPEALAFLEKMRPLRTHLGPPICPTPSQLFSGFTGRFDGFFNGLAAHRDTLSIGS